MPLYSPLNNIIEKTRLLFQRRVKDGQIAYLGNGAGKVEVPNKPGYVYVRFPGAPDANGNATFSSPGIARASGAAFLNYEGAAVYVAVGYNQELEIVSAHYPELDKSGIDTRILNPLHQQSKWVYLWQLTIALCSAVATTVTDSSLITVKKFLHYVGDTLQFFETAEQGDKEDIAAYIPTTDMHGYVGIWLDSYLNVLKVTSSIQQSLFIPLDITDAREATTDRPPDAFGLKLIYVANNQGTITQQPAADVDIRQFLNAPPLWGFKNLIATRERIRPDRQQVYTGSVVVTGSLEVLGSLVGISSTDSGGSGSAPLTSPLTTKGDIWGFSTANARIPVGTNGFPLVPDSGQTLGVKYSSVVTLTEIDDTNGNEQLKFVTTASAVNEMTVTNAATGNSPKLEATGGNTNIGMQINPKGTGTVSIDGAVVINDSGADRDTRIEGDTNANLLFVDASVDGIGIGTNTPDSKTILDVSSTTKLSRPMPLMTPGDRSAISSPPDGGGLYDATNKQYEYYNSTLARYVHQVASNQVAGYREGVSVHKLDSAKIIAGVGSIEVNGQVVVYTSLRTLDLTQSADWFSGSSGEAANRWVHVYGDSSGNRYLSQLWPNCPTATDAVFSGQINGSPGLNGTSIVYDNDTGEGNVTPGMLLLVFTDAGDTGRGRGSGASGNVNFSSAALITFIDTSTNTITVQAGHNINLTDNDRIYAVPFGALLYRNFSGTWLRYLGGIWNNASSDLDDTRTNVYGSQVLSTGSDITTTSTSFTDINSSLEQILMCDGSAVSAEWFTAARNSGANIIGWNLSVDAIDLESNSGVVFSALNNINSANGFARLVTGLLPGTHNFKPRWLASAGTNTIPNGSTQYAHPQFSVQLERGS